MTTQQQKPTLEFFGREGWLDVSKEANFGTRTLYTAGLNNVENREVYDGLIADMKEREANKKGIK